MTDGVAVTRPGEKPAAGIVTAPIIQIDSVTKKFPVRKRWVEILRHPARRELITVLDNVTLRIEEGEFFGLLGQNGAGKTTLFRILSTLILPDVGSVTVAGVDAIGASLTVRTLVAPVIASERSLHWRLDARENLRLYAALQRVPAATTTDEIERVLAVVALTDTGNKMVGTFSSGMRQRLLIARALLGRPRVLLLDEPTRSLDPISARDFRRFLRETIVSEQGCTVVLATHDADDVWNLCDRVAVLDRGSLLAVDNAAALRLRVGDEVYRLWVRDEHIPVNEAVARRLGVPILRSAPSAESGWTELTLEITGGSPRAALYLAELAQAGAAVARFEKTAPDLAEVIERVVRGQRGGS